MTVIEEKLRYQTLQKMSRKNIFKPSDLFPFFGLQDVPENHRAG